VDGGQAERGKRKGKPPVVNENTEATSGAFKKKCGSADARGEEE
jgi:hypothetical protein